MRNFYPFRPRMIRRHELADAFLASVVPVCASRLLMGTIILTACLHAILCQLEILQVRDPRYHLKRSLKSELTADLSHVAGEILVSEHATFASETSSRFDIEISWR